MAVNYTKLSTEQLRVIKKEIEEELSKRHKEREDLKRCCSGCEYHKYDENAHPTWRYHKGAFKCVIYGRNGKIIPTKHVAPSWCPKGQYDDSSLIKKVKKRELDEKEAYKYFKGDAQCC